MSEKLTVNTTNIGTEEAPYFRGVLELDGTVVPGFSAEGESIDAVTKLLKDMYSQREARLKAESKKKPSE